MLTGQDKFLSAPSLSTPLLTKTFTQTEGLPTLGLTAICAGTDGYLYVGSSAGVGRFNGSAFELISTEQYPNLNSNRITHLYSKPDSSLWMVDERAFFSRWKQGTLSSFDTLFTNQATSEWDLKVSSTGDVWISNGTTFMLFDEHEGFKPILTSFSAKYFDFVPINDKLLFILSDQGLFEYRNERLKRSLYLSSLPFNAESQHSVTQRTKMISLSGNQLLLADAAGVFQYNYVTQFTQFLPFPESTPGNVLGIYQQSPDLLLVHKSNAHVILDLSTGKTNILPKTNGEPTASPQNLPIWNNRPIYLSLHKVLYNAEIIFEVDTDEYISDATVDSEGNLWLTVFNRGLVRLQWSPFGELNNDITPLTNNRFYSIIEDSSQQIWATSNDGRVYRMSSNSIENWVVSDASSPNDHSGSIFQRPSNGHIVAGFKNTGLFSYDGQQWNSLLINENEHIQNPLSYYEDNKAQLWIGSLDELYIQEKEQQGFNKQYLTNGAPIVHVQVIEEDPTGVIWLGSARQGLIKKDERENLFQQVFLNDKTRQPRINDIYFSSSDTLWIASENEGLIRVVLSTSDRIEQVKYFGKADGLPSMNVHRILADSHGYFWLSSTQGLTRLEIQQLNHYLNDESHRVEVHHFDEENGLPPLEMESGTYSKGILSSKGYIWIPTQQGIIVFDPASFLEYSPFSNTQISISSIRSDRRQTSLYHQNDYTLYSDERNIILDFDALHFTQPNQLNLLIRIPQLFKTWQHLPVSGELAITNLKAGTYTLEMHLANVPFEEFEAPTFTFTVLPYFYEQSWFLILVTISGVTILAFVFNHFGTFSKNREQLIDQRLQEKSTFIPTEKSSAEKNLTLSKKQSTEYNEWDKKKTDFFISMIQELRTPLSLIGGPLKLLQENKVHSDPEFQEQLRFIRLNSQKLNHSIEQIEIMMNLDSEIDQFGKMGIYISDFCAFEFDQFESLVHLDEKEYSFHSELKNEQIIAHPNLLKQTLKQLFSNAIKFTHKNDFIRLTLTNNDSFVVISVEDNGIGIAQEDVARLTEPFFRSSNALGFEGVGLGLHFVHRYVESLDGKLNIQSTLGEGTSVQMYLPLASKEELAQFESFNPDVLTEQKEEPTPSLSTSKDDTFKEEIIPSTKNKKSTPSSTLLIVEDNTSLRLFLKRLFEQKYSILLANNGISGLEMAKHHLPDLIISDVKMPEKDGIEMVKEIRMDTQLSTTPCILLSAQSSMQSIAVGLSSGAEVYLTKPVDSDIIMAQVDSLLDRERRISNLKNDSSTSNKEQTSSPDFKTTIDEIILRHISDKQLTISNIAKQLDISRATLYRKWNEVSEMNLSEYITEVRLKDAVRLIKEGKYTFSEIAYVCGFSEPSYFSQVFKKYYGLSPSEYAEKTKSNI